MNEICNVVLPKTINKITANDGPKYTNVFQQRLVLEINFRNVNSLPELKQEISNFL